MWINHIFLAFVGLASGLAVAGGPFALIVSLKIIPRIVGKGFRHPKEEILFIFICSVPGLF